MYESLMSYYPNYSILDNIISQNKYKELNIFIDLKNNFQTLYMEHAIVNILEMSKKSRYIDTSIFLSLLSFLSFHKIYSLSRNIKINFYIFFESGVSYYHKNISKTYKISRRIDDLWGLDRKDRDMFFNILQNNFGLIEKACNRMPNIKILKLSNLEADFVPYYLITRNLVSQENIANIVYSNDHDLLQCANDNTFIFQKSAKSKRIVKQGEVMNRELRKENNISDEYQTLAMSIIGDSGDDVEGIKGIGPSRFLSIFPELVSLMGSMETIYSKVMNKQPLFNTTHCKSGNKYLNLIISKELKNNLVSKNLKLVSFELISRAFENPDNIEILKKKQKFHETLEVNNKVKLDVMRNALRKGGVEIYGEELDNIYFGI